MCCSTSHYLRHCFLTHGVAQLESFAAGHCVLRHNREDIWILSTNSYNIQLAASMTKFV